MKVVACRTIIIIIFQISECSISIDKDQTSFHEGSEGTESKTNKHLLPPPPPPTVQKGQSVLLYKCEVFVFWLT